MIGTTGFPVVSRALPQGGRTAVPPAENVRSDNDLKNNAETNDRRRGGAAHESRSMSLSRIGTSAALHRDGVHHSAPFAAQIIGQMLEKGSVDVTLARAAYAKSATTAFDSRVIRSA
jgi:hypothetical protein